MPVDALAAPTKILKQKRTETENGTDTLERGKSRRVTGKEQIIYMGDNDPAEAAIGRVPHPARLIDRSDLPALRSQLPR